MTMPRAHPDDEKAVQASACHRLLAIAIAQYLARNIANPPAKDR